jgi:hypothetical protein
MVHIHQNGHKYIYIYIILHPAERMDKYIRYFQLMYDYDQSCINQYPTNNSIVEDTTASLPTI